VFSPEAFSVSVVIPTTNSPDCKIRRCVAALPADVEVIVVLTKREHLDASWLQHPRARLVQDLEEPFVFARANNRGVRAATGDVVLFLNDDCFFRAPEDVATLCSALHDPSIGAVAPLATYAGNPDMNAGPDGKPTGEVARTFRPLNGFAVAMRRKLFWGLGGWDERYRGYGTDDDDLAARVMERHYRLAVDARVVVDHVGHDSFGRDWEFVHRELERWGEVFEEKWGFARADVPTRFPDPEASVVIPAYNCEDWIGTCIDSVFAQETERTFDVVVVNDGSTDGTRQVIDQLREVHGHALISLRQPNRGASAARNRGVRRSIGGAILFHDADDVMPPDRIQRQLDHLRHVDLSYGQLKSFPENGVPGSGEVIDGIIRPHPDFFWSGNGFRIGTAACRRELFEGHGVWLDERMAAAEDHEWFVHVVAKGFTAGCSQDVYLWRRVVSGSLRKRADYGPLREYVVRKHAKLARRMHEEPGFPPRGEDWTGDQWAAPEPAI
jgi:glycosyltransferase involved in cell wall biosynthesis